MASMPVHIPFLLFLGLALATSQPTPSPIPLGSSLSPATSTSSWLSPSGRFAFGFYPEGSGFRIGVWLITAPQNITITYTALRDLAPYPQKAVLKLTKERLSLQGRAINIPTSDSSSYAASALMLDSGNFIIRDSRLNIIWESFDYPSDTIISQQKLWDGGELISSISLTNHSLGRFGLKMQTDGNLVIYSLNAEDEEISSVWDTQTDGDAYYCLILDATGRLHLNSSVAEKNLSRNYSTGTEAFIYLARLDPDGIFRLYSYSLDSNQTISLNEFPNRKDKCEIPNACGLNSYCTFTDDQLVCLCLPGFARVDASNVTSACQRSFARGSCKNERTITYNMSALENLVWPDYPYNILSLDASKEDCSAACLSDCNCDAALFKDNKCLKHKLPLKNGRLDKAVPTVAFLKVGIEAPAAVPNPRTKKVVSTKTLIVSVALIFGIYVAFVVVGLLIYRLRIRRYRKLLGKWGPGLAEEIGPWPFSYNELREATDGFKVVLGKGSCGTVFRGVFSSGERVIAVKRLEKVVEEGEREFLAEMRAIGRTHHRNLVRLLGFCHEGSNRLLVYEYMTNGSLADLIFKAGGRPPWKERVRIALDIARGIHYLHEECETHIIHCDIKPENILMDEGWTAKISDFGLAKLLMPSQTRTFTGIRGTRGYLAPEWSKNAPISVKADVYSFGIVLLEIVCCRRNIEVEQERGGMVLSEWIYKRYVAEDLEGLTEGEEIEMAELNRLVKVGLWCIQPEPAFRPCMKKVLLMLEGSMDVSLPPPPPP